MVESNVNPKLRFEVKEFKLEIFSHDGKNMTKLDKVYMNKIKGSSFIDYDPLIKEYMDGAYIFVFSDFIFEDNPYTIQTLKPVEFLIN